MSVRVEAQDSVRTVVIDRPDARNAFDDALIAELTRAYEDASADPAVGIRSRATPPPTENPVTGPDRA